MSTFCDVGGGFFFDDVIRCQLPPPCEYLMFSLPHDSHQKMQPLGQGSETTVSPKPSREAPGSEEGVSPFLLRENLRELKIKPIFISIRLS